MRIVHLSTYDEYGGAGIAATRLHRALCAAGADSRMLVRQRRSADATIAQPGGRWSRLWLKLQRRCDRLALAGIVPPARGFSVGWVGGPAIRAAGSLAPDIVHAHWIADGFVQPDALARLRVPVVWTMHDLWAFTGGCHYPGSCERFTSQCGSCPALHSGRDADLSRSGWRRRQQLYARKAVTVVAPSRWMADCARRSALLSGADIRVIPNGVDPERFAPADRSAARQALGLPIDRTILLAGAVQLRDDPRKGYAALVEAMRQLAREGLRERVELAVFGGFAPAIVELNGIRVRALGPLQGDVALARAYAAADLFVLPSAEDNLPNTVMEAMATGLPVLAHAVGGLTDLIDDGENGALVAPAGGALGRAITRLVADPGRLAAWGRAARDKAVRKFTAVRCAEAHRTLYEELVARR